VKGAILLAGLVGGVPVEVHEPAPTRDHSERMLRARGVTVHTEGSIVSLQPVESLKALDVVVPGDPSSAAFLAGLAAIGATAGEVAIDGVGVNPGRTGAFTVLSRMGARIRFEARAEEGGEPVATVVAGDAPLVGTVITAEEIPALIAPARPARRA
jgi:3-phosphoshikimate 1-carboxyvinyltransferase